MIFVAYTIFVLLILGKFSTMIEHIRGNKLYKLPTVYAQPWRNMQKIHLNGACSFPGRTVHLPYTIQKCDFYCEYYNHSIA